jgi:Mn2+/Fe2+ NRAMP family transporter
MFASTIIVVLAVLLGGLSIFAQFANRERREQLRALETPAGAIVFAAIFWLISQSHHSDIMSLALKIALVTALFIPAATYAFSPARKDAEGDSRHPQVRSQDHASPQRQASVGNNMPDPAAETLDDENPVILDGEVIDVAEAVMPLLGQGRA